MVARILFSFITGIGLILIVRKIFRRRKYAICTNEQCLEGKTVVITGANTGIGLAVATELARRKARVILACRNIEKGKNAVQRIKKELNLPNALNLVVRELDLSSFLSVRRFAEKIKETERNISILINNAGVFGCPLSYTHDGLETTFGVNHIGHFLLTNLLLDKLSASAPSRVIIVASKLYERATLDFDNLNAEKSYSPFKAYAQSKLANLLFAHELHKIRPNGVTVNSLHPGFVATDLPRHMLNNAIKKFMYPVFAYLFMRTPYEGAQTVIHLSTSPELEQVSGKYFGDCRIEVLESNACDCETADKLWQMSAKMCEL